MKPTSAAASSLVPFLLLLNPACAFVPASRPINTPTTKTTASALSAVINKDFGRAVSCAESFGLCDADEMIRLADQLEDFDGCVYEDGKELCEKEETDRKDVAETLKMAAELQLRVNYLKNANLFVDDVHKELEMEERERSWQEYRDKHGMGLGLW